MGTEIIMYDDEYNILLKRYWGGGVDGIMFQIAEKNTPFRYVNITEKEFFFMFYKYAIQENKEIEDKDTLYDGHIARLNENREIIKWFKKRYGFGKDEKQ